MNISVVIPTNGRVSLVERLLKSLVSERENYPYGATEVIVVDSSQPDDAEKIRSICSEYEADCYKGENSVRKKRNLGIRMAKYEIILFLDSDVAAKKGLLQYHANGYLKEPEKNLGGVLGVTRFVGKKAFWWKVVEQTTYLDSFSFAERFPYHSWTIGNNVSFYKSVLMEVGLFEEKFPYPLGGDDLDLTYRITKSGYLIKSAPKAVTLHSTETWNHFKAIYDRTRRWGSMEYYISRRHPEIFVNCIPKSCILFLLVYLICTVISLITKSVQPMWFANLWAVFHYLFVYIYDCVHGSGGGILSYLLGKGIRVWYRLYYEMEGIKNGDFTCFRKEMSFSLNQTKYMQQREMAVYKIFWLVMAVLMAGFYIFSHLVR